MKFSKIFTWVLISSLLLITGILVGISYLSEKHLQLLFNSPLFEDKTPEVLAGFRTRSFYSGFYVLAFSILLFIFRKKIWEEGYSFFTVLKEKFILLKPILRKQWKAESRKYTVAFLAIFIFSILIRLFFIDGPLHYDEGYTFYHYSQKPIYVLVSYYDFPNNHLFHTLLVKLSCFLFGESTISLRLTAFIFGILMMPLSYLYFSRNYTKGAGLLATSFIASSSFLICYSTNARGYSILFLAFILLLIIVEEIKKTNAQFWWISFVLVQIIGIYTVPIMIYESVLFSSYLVVSKISMSNLKIKMMYIGLSFFSVILVSILLYLPICWIMGPKFITSNGFVATKPISYAIIHSIDTLKPASNFFYRDVPLIFKLLIPIGIIASLLYQKNWRMLYIAILTTLVFIFFIQKVIPPPRVLAFLYILFFFSAADGLYLIIKHSIKKTFYIIASLSFLSIVLSTLILIRTKSPSLDFDEVPVINFKEIFLRFKANLKSDDRLYTEYPYEASVRSYFSFYKIPDHILNTNYKQANRIFLWTHRKKEKMDITLQKNEIDPAYFHQHYQLVSETIIDGKTSRGTKKLYEYHRK